MTRDNNLDSTFAGEQTHDGMLFDTGPGMIIGGFRGPGDDL